MKLLGAGFLWISLTYLGVAYAHRLKDRITILENTALMINKLKIGTEFLGLSSQNILENICQSQQLSKLDFIEETISLIAVGEDFPVAWSKAVDNTSLDYKTEEKTELLHLGENQGTSDMKNQIAMLEMYESSFREFIAEAKSQYAKQAKTATLLGALSGCLLFITLI